MVPAISVITPASRGVKHLTYLLNDFKNQTFKNFEHVIVHDGEPPEDVIELMKTAGPWTKFCNIKKDRGNMNISPGTNARNHGLSLAQGQFVVFCDDDDRYKDLYLESLINGLQDNCITVVQMSCQHSRMYKDGDPNRIVLVPEIGIPVFPLICHVGTPCFIIKKEWAIAEPWRHEPEHDFRFIKRICERFKPMVRIVGGMLVDVDGLVIRGMRDWVSHPPFNRSLI